MSIALICLLGLALASLFILGVNPTGPGYPGGGNTFVPPDISAKLRIGFSRNPNKFHLPKYIQYVETPHTSAYYLKITSQEATRIINTQDFAWPDGSPDPTNDDGTESFNFIPFTTSRNRYKFRLGDIAAQQAAWPIIEQNSQNKASQCMTARTIRVMNAATTVSSWQQSANADNAANLTADHTATANALVGGYLDQGSSTNPLFMNALGAIADLVNQDTLGVIDAEPENYFVIMNPRTARLIAASPEMHDYLKGSYYAKEARDKNPNAKYNLPPEIYGYKIIVENAVVTTSRKGAAVQTRSYAMPSQTILVASRVGALEGLYAAPSFSTLTLFYWRDEMTVEAKHDDWDRLTFGRVVENTFETITCTASGYLLTQATSI